MNFFFPSYYSQFGKQRIDSELQSKKKSNDDSDSEDSDDPSENTFIDRTRFSYDSSIDNLMENERQNFQLSDLCDYIKLGVQAIVDDEVTIRFDTEGISFIFYCLFLVNRYFFVRAAVMESFNSNKQKVYSSFSTVDRLMGNRLCNPLFNSFSYSYNRHDNWRVITYYLHWHYWLLAR